MTKAIRLFRHLRERKSIGGLTEAIFALAGLISYPRGGFPRHGVDEFMRSICSMVGDGALVLDAGAGGRPYKRLFNHAVYHSCEYEGTYEKVRGDASIKHTFYCDLETIPIEDNTYDAIICNQVLEHVKRPHRVLQEFRRILKPDGQLFLTVPQCHGCHMAPYNYFNFISYGLLFLLEEARFRKIAIKPLGGVFWLFGAVMMRGYETLVSRVHSSLRPLVLPLHVTFRLAFLPICFVLFHLDKFDDKNAWTLNYGCSCVK
jgi:SAM-dependent methyltransferase